jgi:hypothetical protein
MLLYKIIINFFYVHIYKKFKKKTKLKAKQETRWVLVNIQYDPEISSHYLNIDLWRNETIESIIRNNFVFWQRGHTSKDGKYFMKLYGLTDKDLPYICIVDPRTGVNCKNLTVFFL